jgi:hypothetical protein
VTPGLPMANRKIGSRSDGRSGKLSTMMPSLTLISASGRSYC